MAIRWSRTALHARLEALEERHQGQALIDAVVEFADTLEEDDRELLQGVLLERAGRDRSLVPAARVWAARRRRLGFPPPPDRDGPER